MGFTSFAILFAACKSHLSPEDHAVNKIIRQAIEAGQKDDFKTSDKLCHEALALIKSYGEKNLWPEKKVILATVFVFDFMGKQSMANGDLKRAEVLFKECIKGLIEAGREQNDDAVIELSLKLALIYASQRKFKDADIGYNFCIDTQRKKLQEDGALAKGTHEEQVNSHALLGMCLHAYGKFLIAQKQFDKALESMDECVQIADKWLSKEHPQLPVLYCDLANAYTLNDKFDDAMTSIERAEVLAKQDSPTMVWILCNKGPIEARTQKKRRAKSTCASAAGIANKLNNQKLVRASEECFKRIEAPHK